MKPKLRRVLLAACLVLLGLATVFFLNATQRSSGGLVATIVNTNVASVSVRVLRAPQPAYYYYPNRLRYEWDQLRKRVGLSVKSMNVKLRARPSQPCDVMWVTFAFHGMPEEPKTMTAEFETERGRCAYQCDGGIIDEKRRVVVCRWQLVGDLLPRQGRTMRITRVVGGEELIRIQVP